jgi:CRISPR-associated endonuclease/helicase Cas3
MSSDIDKIDRRDDLIAHKTDDGRIQPLSEHLRNVAQRAGEFAAAFDAQNWARAAALLHDDGKALNPFQKRIRGAPVQVDHSTPGAEYAEKRMAAPRGFGKLLAYCIAGHHAGLPDGNAGDDDTCLARRLARAHPGPGYLASELPRSFEGPPIPKAAAAQRGFAAAFFVRMVFSCLVDADFLDTEDFFQPEKPEKRGSQLNLEQLKSSLDAHLSQLGKSAPQTEVNRLRTRILNESRAAAGLAPGLFSMSVPTGGGKTLSSMAFALEHALSHGMRRVIYVIPYTSIIEQTAAVFRKIFGPEAVLEHHSNFIQESEDADEEREERRRLAAENWDAPIVVTTNVQFFESFFSNRTSRTRKLHNVASSVVVLDEAQILPVPMLRPTLATIRELSGRYRVSVVLCTATQPALSRNDDFKGGLENVREIVSEPLYLERAFARVRPTRMGRTADAEVTGLMSSNRQSLCIVNTKRHARLLFQALGDREGVFHLSAAMCPVHRTLVLGDPTLPSTGSIRGRLAGGFPCRVVSTQLVEAGVDVDFPVVIRAMTGIDSIIQAAGRCNREGRRPDGGRLYVFTPEDPSLMGMFRQNVQIAEIALSGRQDALLDSDTVRAYFKELFWIRDQTGGLDREGIMALFEAAAVYGDFPFKTVAGLYRIIPEQQIPVIVPYDDTSAELCERLRYNTKPGAILRQLQRYTVQVYPRQLVALREAGYVETLQEERYFVLSPLGRKEVYDDQFGLNTDLSDFIQPENLMLYDE